MRFVQLPPNHVLNLTSQLQEQKRGAVYINRRPCRSGVFKSPKTRVLNAKIFCGNVSGLPPNQTLPETLA